MPGGPPLRDDGDLHRLVDGLLDSRRLGEVLLRLKSHAAEAARVAAWREQNELLKAAFAGVEQDPIPASLRLTPLRLRCIGDDERPAGVPPVLAGPAPLRQAWPADKGSRNHGGVLVAKSCFAVTLAALAASWLALAHRAPTARTALPAMGEDAGDVAVVRALDEDQTDASAARLPDLPTTTIPDLGRLGFAFTGAAARTAPRRVLLFSYQQNGGAGRLTLSVSRPRGREPADPAPPGAFAWQRDGRAFLLSGTLPPERMALVAAFLQAVDPLP